MIRRPPLLRALAPVMASVRLLFSPTPTRALDYFLLPPSVRLAGNGGVARMFCASPTDTKGLSVARLRMQAGVGNGSAVHWGPLPADEGEEVEAEEGGGDDALVAAELEAVMTIGEECDRMFVNHWGGREYFIAHFLSTARSHPVLAARLERFPLLSESYEAMLPAQRREMLEGVAKGVMDMRGGLDDLVAHRDAVREAMTDLPLDGEGGGTTRYAYRAPVNIDWTHTHTQAEQEGETQRLLRHRKQVEALWGGRVEEGEEKEEEQVGEEVQVGMQEVVRERGEGLGLCSSVRVPHSDPDSTPPPARELCYHTRGAYVLDFPLSHAWFLTPRHKAALAEEGVHTIRHLINHFPRAYLDFSASTSPLQDGQQVALIGRVESLTVSPRGSRHAYSRLQVVVAGGYRISYDKWVNTRYPAAVAGHMKKQFPAGAMVCLNGKVTQLGGNAFELKPGEVKRVEEGEEGEEEVVSCVYPAKGAITPLLFQTIMKRTCAELPVDMDPLGEILGKEALPLREAYLGLHGGGRKEDARDRLIFDEFFYHQAGMLLQRTDPSSLPSPSVAREQWAPLAQTLLALLPYHLTLGQEAAVGAIVGDLRGPSPMNRLLQGDVGCGKTVVALLGLMEAVSRGYQAALMAPTEFLAAQHYERFQALMGQMEEGERPTVALLTGSTKKAKALRESIGSGEVAVVVGTQALISEGTLFHRLGMVVVDEQHRFGVNQRTKLVEKGLDTHLSSPHVLAMSATPIPRTLALALYGDMKITQITDLPKGRKAVVTRVVTERREAYEAVREEVEGGGRAFVVFPRVEESEEAPDVRAVEEEFARIERGGEEAEVSLLRGLPCGLVHGRMGSEAKAEALRAFCSGETKVLFCTTVIEVGIDIPEATVMVVENAERYGLAALHQLRGRVGRGTRASQCLLLTASPSGRDKLEILETSQDGFKLAEEDLVRRGAGELLGQKQSGHLPSFSLVNYQTDGPILLRARRMAEEVIERYPRLEGLPRVEEELRARFSVTSHGM